MSLKTFIQKSSFVLIGLHGGMGENGTLQCLLHREGVKFNGAEEEASRICMDKWESGECLKNLEKYGITIAPKYLATLARFKSFKTADFEEFFRKMQKELKSRTVIVKPRAEGCSTGIVRLFHAHDLQTYIRLMLKGAPFAPKGTFRNQRNIVELPHKLLKELLFEPFIETDAVRVRGNRLKWKRKKGWIEITIGVLEIKGKLHALSPSLTVAEGEVLSVEEKFQGGTGINLTPPPEKVVKPAVLARVKRAAQKVAEILGIRGYCRIDAFMNTKTGDMMVIEVNTLPALTPSTVLFHQALAEKKPLYPKQLLELLIRNKDY